MAKTKIKKDEQKIKSQKKAVKGFSQKEVSVQKRKSEVVLQLKNLRMQTKEIAQNHSNRLQSEISTMIEEIQNLKLTVENGKSSNAVRMVLKINSAIQNLKLKPRKGRFKDLHKIHDTIKTLPRGCKYTFYCGLYR